MMLAYEYVFIFVNVTFRITRAQFFKLVFVK